MAHPETWTEHPKYGLIRQATDRNAALMPFACRPASEIYAEVKPSAPARRFLDFLAGAQRV